MHDHSFFELHRKSKVAVVCFAGNGSRIDEPPLLEFQKTLKSIPTQVHQIFIRDDSKHWYLFGVKNHPSIFQLAEHLKKSLGNKPTLFIGSCAGAFGALMMGHLLQATKVLAFHPPAYINQQYNAFSPRTPLVYELARDMNRVAQMTHLSKEYMDLNMFTDLFSKDTALLNKNVGWKHAIVYHNPTDTSMAVPIDHQYKLERLPNTDVVLVESGGKGHEYNVAAEMKKDGVLQPLIETAIKEIQ